MILRRIGAGPLCWVLASCSAPKAAEDTGPIEAEALLAAKVLTTETAKTQPEEWGTFVEYSGGETSGTQDLLSGTATIKPGLEIHPPHRHHEEEFLMVLEGEWIIGEEVFPAKTGDMRYADAWKRHEIKNTGDTPLTFVFWKWHSKGLPFPADQQL